MDNLIITIPDWVVCIVGLWFVLSIVESSINIYMYYLNKKLEHIKKTNTSTVGPFRIKIISEDCE